jgi:hypothetical protein
VKKLYNLGQSILTTVALFGAKILGGKLLFLKKPGQCKHTGGSVAGLCGHIA